MILYLKSRTTALPEKQILSTSVKTSVEAGNQKNVFESNPEKINTPIDFGPNVEVQKMDRMRKLIGEHMMKSVQTSAHVCSFVEADMTNIVLWRNKVKTKFKEKYGENLTFTPILIEAIAKALIEFPMINSSIDGENILLKKEINIGMAAALPDGNLIVPVIKNADMLNLLGLAKKVNDLGQRAKKNQLKPDEIQGGTYTMTNLGSFGNLFGTPIINQPQVAILGVGAIVKKPIVVESPEGDTIGIRSMMYLSHSYDHRVVDGMLGGTFVKRLAEILEGFDVNREL
jgi:2-oxoglutarate dehydrogenase E2 component (dihydrolipoamide succinyltransferase)